MIDTDALLRHGNFVRRLARSLVADADLAQDIAQETWLAALQRPPRRRDNLRGWLAAVTRNLARLRRRSDIRRLARERARARPRDTADPGEVVARLEWERRIAEAVRKLDEPYRSTIVYRFFEQLRPEDIARRMDVPRKTVYTRIQRALDRLRKQLDGEAGSRRAWCLALLPLAFDHDTITSAAAAAGGGISKGAAVMAGKLSFAGGGLVIGAMTMFAVTEATRTDGSPRAAPRASAERAPTAPKPEAGEQPAPAVETAAELSPEDRADAFLRRINAATDFGQLNPIAAEMLKLKPNESRDLFFGIYDRINTAQKRATLAYLFSIHPGYPYVLDMLDRCIRDGDLDRRTWSLRRLKPYALIDFEEMPDAYEGWREQTKGLSKRDALLRSGRLFAERLRTLEGKALQKELRIFRHVASRTPTLKDIGLLDVFTEILKTPVPEEEHNSTGDVCMMQRNAWRWIESLQPNETYLKEVVLPYARQHRNRELGENPYHALALLARSKKPWVFDELVALLYDGEQRGFGLGGNFGEYGDKRAIPHLIGAIAADPKYETIYGLGYFGLGVLTGVAYDESHDGDWWLGWWDRNKDGLPAEVRAIDPRTLR